ncbi:MAG: divergent polysaccharide deacetylase family protein [Alphaproteobacteria bacterium]|nr:divergent polysaccharide deacetylase family protein [Alphaproteobacteria bacterium]
MKEETKIKLKKFLTYLSIFLAVLWVAILTYGLLVEKEVNNKMAIVSGEKVSVDITKPMDEIIVKEEQKKEEFEQGIQGLISPQSSVTSLKEGAQNLKGNDLNKNVTISKLNQNIGEDKTSNTMEQSTNDEAAAKKLEEEASLKQNTTNDEAVVKVAILISNLGGNQSILDAALNLPADFTMGFSSFGGANKQVFEKVIKSGKDVLLYLPFQPKDYPISAPGPYAILEEHGQGNIETLAELLAVYPGIKGGYGNSREFFTSKQEKITPIIEYLQQQNLNLIISRPIDSADDFLSKYDNVILCDQIIDELSTASGIKTSLANLVSIAKKRGYAVGYANTYPITLKVLSEWINELPAQKVKIVPLSLIKK